MGQSVTIVLRLWCAHHLAGKLLVECAGEVVARRKLPKGSVVGYEEIAEESFGKLGRLLISSIIYVELFGTCALLFILEVRMQLGAWQLLMKHLATTQHGRGAGRSIAKSGAL